MSLLVLGHSMWKGKVKDLRLGQSYMLPTRINSGIVIFAYGKQLGTSHAECDKTTSTSKGGSAQLFPCLISAVLDKMSCLKGDLSHTSTRFSERRFAATSNWPRNTFQ